MIRAVLIDDEALAREDLRRLLRAHPMVTIVGEAATMTSALARLAQRDYDLVFLDVHIIGGTGFDLVSSVAPPARFIFVTAFDTHALRAFEVNAVDYLLKPLLPARLAESLARLITPAMTLPAVSGNSPGKLRPDDLVNLKTSQTQTRFVPVAEIAAVRACENYSEVHLQDSSRHFVRHTLKAWEERLPATHFARVHRNVIIGLQHYRGADYVPEGTSRVHVAGVTEPMPASYRYWRELRARLDALGIAG